MSDDVETPKPQPIGEAVASPTKDFFVNMLTRDIELQDALLDLLDNCVDGILRSSGQSNSEKPYDGFRATITIAPDHFQIEDNCGGIPREVAEKYAFSMGRPPEATVKQLKDAATVGMYGIGMKRAIFKLGSDALVETLADEGFSVEFSPEWMKDEGWDNLPMYPLPSNALAERGTRVTVYRLHDESARAFENDQWIEDFKTAVSRHYALIMAKGFSVRIGTPAEIEAGTDAITPAEFKLLETAAMDDGSRIEPFIYSGTIDGVNVEIYAGLYRELLTAEEAATEEQTRGSTDDAGWTVACNDRVVIWKDKTRLTGWGDGTVPNYHGQFIAITGLVLLHSTEPKKLPLTTTKRGIDAASNIYAEAKDLMRDATKKLTTFTNKWKKHERQLESIYRASEYVELPKLRAMAAERAQSKVRKFDDMRRADVKLPIPINETTTSTVSFVADKSEIEKLGGHFFGDQEFKPTDVGLHAWEDCVRRYLA